MKAVFTWVFAASFLFGSQDIQAQSRLEKSQNGNQGPKMEFKSFHAKTLNQERIANGKKVRSFMAKQGACSDTLLFENFENGFPEDFTNLDLDGNTDANGRPAEWYIAASNESAAGDTNFAASSSSWFTPFAQANNWMITPALAICDSAYELTWKSAPYEGPAFLDGYKVAISTTTNDISAFTDTVAIFAEDLTGTGLIGPGTVHTLFDLGKGLLQTSTISLDDYVGDTIYVAFIHDSNDDNQLYVDDIVVRKEVDIDLSLVSFSSNLEYAISPEKHVQEIGEFTATAINNSLFPLTNVTLDVSIDAQAGGNVYSASDYVAALLSGATDTFTIAQGYTPSAIDDYTLAVSLNAGLIDLGFSTTNFSQNFSVSDSTYARDNGVVDGSLSIGVGAPGVLGQSFELSVADALTSVDVYREGGAEGDSLRVHVYDMLDGKPNQLLASTEWYIDLDTNAGLRSFAFPEAITLAEGGFYVGIEEVASSAAQVGTNSEMFRAGVTHVFYNGTWYNNEDFGFNVVYVLRPNFGAACVGPKAAFSDSLDVANLSLTNNSIGDDQATYLWDFGDGNTSTDANPTHTYADNGTYNVCLTVTNDCGTDTECKPVTVSRVSIEENPLSQTDLYPNPAQEQVFVHFQLAGTYTVNIFNTVGQTMYREVVQSQGGQHSINLDGFEPGLYFVNVDNGANSYSLKLVVNQQ